MSVGQISAEGGKWLGGAGPLSEVVISSRVRLARNLAGYPFVNRASSHQQSEIMARCHVEALGGRLGDDVLWLPLSDCDPTDLQWLVERHLISRQHAQATDTPCRAVAVGADESFSIMVNEEDHLRLQVLRSGMQLAEAFEQIDQIDDALEQQLDYAYSKRFGYLSACPTNVGTGIRVSVMLHLPALRLTGEIEKVRRAAREMQLAVRGMFGEGSEALGDLYQISNQTTLGRSEQEILSEFQHNVVPQIVAYEQQARQAMLQQRPIQLDDRVWRAWAILMHARMISNDEVLSLLSQLRLGVILGRVDQVDIRTVNELILVTQPAHLHRLTGCDMDPSARRIARARLIQEKLGAR
jgi:protein arginine kinase